VRESVRFAAALATAAKNVDILVEVGPGTTLLGLARQCLGEGTAVTIPSLRQAQPDMLRMLESLATLWTAGVPVDWSTVHRDAARRRVSLPTYAFQRERYWLPVSTSTGARGPRASTRRATASAHPLLGSRLPSPLASVQFETELCADAPAFLGDHRIVGETVVPATAYVEMIGAAAEAVRPGPSTLHDLTLQQSLVIPAGEARTVQVVVTLEADAALVEVWSRAGEDATVSWRLHASGRARFVAVAGPQPSPRRWPRRRSIVASTGEPSRSARRSAAWLGCGVGRARLWGRSGSRRRRWTRRATGCIRPCSTPAFR
jgi:acyl transferase domain-containing protein